MSGGTYRSESARATAGGRDPAASALAESARPAGRSGQDASPRRRRGLRQRLSARLESHGIVFRRGALSAGARRELLLRGLPGTATVLGVRPRRTEPGYHFWVRVRAEGLPPYETRVRQWVGDADLELMRPGDVVGCRVDPGDHERMVLYAPGPAEATRVSIAKILADGRRADATVLTTTPVAADYSDRDNPLLRLDMELRAWDEPRPWRVRIVQPVPLTALQLVDLGRHLEVAFFTVDRGESVAVDWQASAEI
ncbi:hypothetical protein [Nocardia sp. BMG51109]|uniref:hypothetical protein n=1 Tax=Nocardia sp. BMG51109 TaxID=1056816 RepID=UPI0004654CB5|nr:hypothetical protein [Nocardia sp. BMG51109]